MALLPDPALQRDLVRFRQAQGPLLGGPVLGLDVNLPHLSVLQCPYRPQELTPEVLTAIADTLSGPVTAALTTLEYQPVGWAFALLAPSPALVKVQANALTLTRDLLDVEGIDSDVTGCDAGTAVSQRLFGYRYVGANFRPHITLGRVALEVPASCAVAFAQEFTGRQVHFDQVVFYRAGAFGVLEQVLAAHRI